MDGVLDIFKSKPRLINGKVFMERFAEKYFTETYTDKTRKGKLISMLEAKYFQDMFNQ